jgi:sulfide:quinone oxidoreductase
VVVLGAGFAGLEVATRLSEAAADRVDVVVVDSSPGFTFGFSKLDMMFRGVPMADIVHSYAHLDRQGVRFLQSTVRAIDPLARRVTTDDEVLDADVLVVALGADTHPEATPGLVEGGHEFYSVAGAAAAAEALAGFTGGHVVVGVTSTPFKCPPAPSETALLVHDYLVERGLRTQSEISLVLPLPVPIPPSPPASELVLAALAERGIHWHPGRLVRAVDGDRGVLVLDDATELPYALFLAVPAHRPPEVVIESGLTEDGWIPVDPQTLETRFPAVYAAGDVTSVGTPKAGVFAEGQAAVVAEQILARLDGVDCPVTYDGKGICYLEVGAGQLAKVDVTFRAGERPFGGLEGPSPALMADKEEFGRSRLARWLAHDDHRQSQ